MWLTQARCVQWQSGSNKIALIMILTHVRYMYIHMLRLILVFGFALFRLASSWHRRAFIRICMHATLESFWQLSCMTPQFLLLSFSRLPYVAMAAKWTLYKHFIVVNKSFYMREIVKADCHYYLWEIKSDHHLNIVVYLSTKSNHNQRQHIRVVIQTSQ